jgi:hypothetical protein
VNFVIISFDNLRYNALTCYGNKAINTYVFDAFAKQSLCFHNFRLPSPIPRENIQFILKHLEDIKVEREITFFDDCNQFTLNNDFVGENITDKNDFIIWRHCNPPSDLQFYDYNGYILFMQEKARALIDYLDEDGYINDKTIVILMGMAGQPVAKKSKVFSSETTLYDDLLHVPLIVFHPHFQARDIKNSVSLDIFANTFKYWIDPSFEGETFLELCEGENTICDKRWDIYSHHKSGAGLRGPMFQYYCKTEEGRVVEQELYDLNNDYTMEHDLVLHAHNLSTQIIDLINTYRKRVIGRFF